MGATATVEFWAAVDAAIRKSRNIESVTTLTMQSFFDQRKVVSKVNEEWAVDYSKTLVDP